MKSRLIGAENGEDDQGLGFRKQLWWRNEGVTMSGCSQKEAGVKHPSTGWEGEESDATQALID